MLRRILHVIKNSLKLKYEFNSNVIVISNQTLISIPNQISNSKTRSEYIKPKSIRIRNKK